MKTAEFHKKVSEIISKRAYIPGGSESRKVEIVATGSEELLQLAEEYAQQSTLNRDKVMEILTSKAMSSLDEIVDALCSLSLPTQKRKDPIDPLDSYYLKDGKWHCVICDKPMNLPTLSEDEIYHRVLNSIEETGAHLKMKPDNWRLIVEAVHKELTKPKEE
jgi:hypothetical protein